MPPHGVTMDGLFASQRDRLLVFLPLASSRNRDVRLVDDPAGFD
jgi:hypothetical protein